MGRNGAWWAGAVVLLAGSLLMVAAGLPSKGTPHGTDASLDRAVAWVEARISPGSSSDHGIPHSALANLTRPVPETGHPTNVSPNQTAPPSSGNRTNASVEGPLPNTSDVPPMRLGMHVSGLQHLEQQPDAPVDPEQVAYGQVWVGPWNLEHGWERVGRQLDWMHERNITPVIQVFYWGNDISRECLEDGCRASGTYKTTSDWSRLVRELGAELEAHLGDGPAVVVLEPEFNKGPVATYEPLDAALANRAREMHEAYPESQVALGFGGWAPQLWHTWDRAVAASDLVGLQLMRGSTQDSQATYAQAAETLVHQVRRLDRLYAAPILINDVALATYPGQPYVDLQAQELGEVLDRWPDLEAAGVQGIIYRALLDDPTTTTAEYYGAAERSWGLAYANGTAKPAGNVWIQALQVAGNATAASGG